MPSDHVVSQEHRSSGNGSTFFEVPGYGVREKLSENAAFRIYRAERTEDHTPVLLKVLNRPYPTSKLLAPLWQEFETLRLLDFPGVEKAIALENHQQWWMIVLEDHGGQPVNQLELSGQMEPKDFLQVALQLAEILESIHSRQVIHKNISPSNISYNPSTHQVWLTNFSYASLVSKEKVPIESPSKLAEALAYVSPELTGRMNRTVDYRTDYYSLGATLYELLTGTPPFMSESLLELVHAHLAILPDPPESRIQPWASSPEAFQILASILFKLLAKNPEDRYQTTAALQLDLHHCLSILQLPYEEDKARPSFVPGQFDRPGDLIFPQIVVGRREETATLEQAFLRVVGKPKELVLISGETGVGKTVLVNQLIRPVTEQMGLFLTGRFSPEAHVKIYSALIDILEEFCRLVLSEPAAAFESWRERVQMAVAPHGQLLTDLCPEFEKVIGPQPPVQRIEEGLARSRFQRVVIRLLQAICQPTHPVVIFLDDLQWINSDSIQLWKSIVTAPSIQNLLVVGAYQDVEITSEHPIYQLVHEVQKAKLRITEILLENLEWPLLQHLIAATLSSNPSDIAELTTLIYMRTDGNPYFSIELLKSLYKDHILNFDPVETKWVWDTRQIKEYGDARNVGEFYIHRIAALDEETQKTIQYAALIGPRFTTANLLALFGPEKAGSLASSLWQAMRADLIHPLDENYRLLASENLGAFSSGSGKLFPTVADVLEEQILFEFTDNYIQQSAIDMLDEKQIVAISLHIGWLLLEKAEVSGHNILQENLLTIVDHLNKGTLQIKEADEAIRAAQLNLQAGNLVRSLAAFQTAFKYYSTGIRVLSSINWEEAYGLMLELHIACAEVALVNGDLEDAEALALAAEEKAHTLLEKIRSMNIHIEIYMLRGKLDQAIELGIAAIRLLGYDLEVASPAPLSVEKMMQMPEMVDATALAVARLAEPLISACFARNPVWHNLFIDFYLDLFSRYGNPVGAGFVYISYAVGLISRFVDIEYGCRLGKMAMELAEQQGPSRNLYAVRFVYYGFIHHWLEPARDGLISLEENFQPTMESGDVIFSLHTRDINLQNSILVGQKLDLLRSKYEDALQLRDMRNQMNFRLRLWSEVILNLTGEPAADQEWNSDLLHETEDRVLGMAGQSQINLFNLYVAKAFLSLLFRKPQQALENASAASEVRISENTQLILPYHMFIYSLALLSVGVDTEHQAEQLQQVEENLRLMNLWARLVPHNFLHQLELVEAEYARTLGHDEQASKYYELSIQDARRNGYIHESGLAAELAGEFYLAREEYIAAIDHLCTAYYSYLAWGATAKVADLVNRYPDWLPPGKDSERRKITSSMEEQPADQLGSSIDLTSILKASMELAQETSLEELLRKMMAILIENAGAQNGSLILAQNDRWFLRVQGSTDPEQGFALLSIPLEYLSPQVGKPFIPMSIIHYVINLKEDLVLEDASTSRQFNRDAYIQTRQPKSILCAPLMNQGALLGIVYLENNLITGAFTSERLEMVRLISGQATVSIEKARLYETMEAQVEERTRELSDANRRLKEEINQRIRIEDALRLSELRYRTLFESTGTSKAVLDEEGYLILINENFTQLTGYSRGELENHFNALQLIAPADLDRILKVRQQALTESSKIPFSFEFKLIHKSGIEKAVLATNTFIPGTQSTIASLLDITARKAAEEALRYNEALLRQVLEILPVGIWILDKEARVIKGNPEAYRIWSGANYVEWQEFDLYKAWRRETGQRVSAKDWAANRAMENGQSVFDEELEIEAFDGTHKIILNSAIPLSTEQDGLIGAIAVNQDITRRKKDEEELKAAHDQLASMLEISQSLVSTLDLDQLLSEIIEQLGKVMPYEAAAVLILEQDQLGFRVIRGPAVFESLLNYQIPSSDLAIIEALLNRNESIYLADLHAEEDLIGQIEQNLKLPSSVFAYLRSWLILPLIAKGELIGCLVLTHSEPDYYPQQSRTLSQAYANQVAIAIHNAQLYKQSMENAAIEERNRLARELHDSVAQALYSISLFIDATRMALKTNKPQVVENHLEELTQLSKEAMSDMRLMIFELRPPILEKIGLVAALQNRLESVEARAGFQASFEATGDIHLSTDEEIDLYRIAQEALNNVVKHAQANKVKVAIHGQEGFVRLIIQDDGIGFDPQIAYNRGGQGFRNMHERAARVGAHCSFESRPGKGTQITVELKQE